MPVTELVEEPFEIPGGVRAYIATPDLRLHCSSHVCGGVRTFSYTLSKKWVDDKILAEHFLRFRCRNCGLESKTFAVALRVDLKDLSGVAFKFGELPSFGEPVPSKLLELVGPDRDLFLKGRRAEQQGMGIGAFGYYRRVVENQKSRIIERVIKVARRIELPSSSLDSLEAAAEETQFSTAVRRMGEAFPRELEISGKNPLTLLHSVLSEGLHSDSDVECLKAATSVRVVLTELAKRIQFTLEERAGLDEAIRYLDTKRSGSPTSQRGARLELEEATRD